MYLSELAVKSQGYSNDISRTGLYFRRTGSPVFVLATTAEIKTEPIEITDSSQILDLIPESTHLVDKLLHLIVRGFFAVGGERLKILPIQIDSKVEDLNSEYYSRILGADLGYIHRSGFHKLKNYDAVGDLLAFPQAAAVLGAQELRSFYSEILRSIEGEGIFFVLLDSPCYSSVDSILEWSKTFDSPRGAVFYPWFSVQNLGFFPLSILMSAQLQNYDQVFGISQSPANRDLPENVQGLHDLAEEDIRRLTQQRINVLRRLPGNRGMTIWGCSTLSRRRKLIHTSRTLVSLQDAIERTCESYLLEAKTKRTCERIEENVRSLLKLLQAQGLFAENENSEPFRVSCKLEAENRSFDSGIFLDVEVAVENPSDYIGLHLKY